MYCYKTESETLVREFGLLYVGSITTLENGLKYNKFFRKVNNTILFVYMKK